MRFIKQCTYWRHHARHTIEGDSEGVGEVHGAQ
jgi:hypothetical protein